MENNETHRAKRVNPKERIDVINFIGGDVLAQIVNISISGMMLASRQKFTDDQMFQTKMKLASFELSVGLECVWAETQESGMTYGGFMIIDISDQDKGRLQHFIETQYQ